MFDSHQVRARRKRADAMAVEGADFLARLVLDDLDERLATVIRTFDEVKLLGDRASVDLAAVLKQHGHGSKSIEAIEFTGDDPARLGEQTTDLIVSFLDLQDVSDPAAYLASCRRALRPDGLFLGAFVGGESLGGLREALLIAETEQKGGASPRVHPAIALRDAGALLQHTGFALPVIDRETTTVRYDSLFNLMLDLRAMGATNALAKRSRQGVTRTLLGRAAEIYQQRNGDEDGRVRAVFEIIWLSGWAPDSSQQKPLKPGSAKVSLASALGELDGE
ncbi:methyltransferase domain-containing protein [Notoacmeibacter ruber]|uniref:Methyltransferase domain-containing protein n=1 Tax=Notoacmeibacter ruber TaxID=2670375 RepID=A0A3L7JCR4_9HYPH|nr:methyltransferase domain-containing protein [Notoacmeibacter ruber]RLQ88578.1 methyltransferase domain-containing protein [Notoacmeibacter ruber]